MPKVSVATASYRDRAVVAQREKIPDKGFDGIKETGIMGIEFSQFDLGKEIVALPSRLAPVAHLLRKRIPWSCWVIFSLGSVDTYALPNKAGEEDNKTATMDEKSRKEIQYPLKNISK